MSVQDTSLLPEVTGDEIYLNGSPDLPYSLNKATCDPFDYALGLKDGTVIIFREASYDPRSKWIHLAGVSSVSKLLQFGELKATYDRGIDVRISEIAWCADAPFGS